MYNVLIYVSVSIDTMVSFSQKLEIHTTNFMIIVFLDGKK